MIVYNVLAVLSLLLHPILNNKKLYTGIMSVLLILVAGLRSVNVGTDTLEYIFLYEKMKNLPLVDSFGIGNHIEIGNIYIIFLSSVIYDSPYTFVFFMAFFTVIILGFFIYRIAGEDYHIATFVIITFGFYAYLMNAERQALAIAISCHAIYYIFQHSYAKAVLICALASCFHLSLIIMLPIVLLLKLFDRELGHGLRLTIFFLSSLVVVVTFYYGYNLFFDNPDLLGGRFVGYLDIMDEFNAPREMGLTGKAFLCICLLTSFVLNLVPVGMEQQRQNFIIGFLLLVAVLLMLAQINIIYIFYRLVDTFSIYLCIGVPFVFRFFRNSYYKDVIMLLFFLMSLVVMNYMGLGGINGVYPYAFGI